jgi:hypothetical protein
MAPKNRRAFLQNVAALSLLNVPDAIGVAANPSQTGRPPIQFDFAANLDRDDLYKYLDSKVTTPPWKAPLTVPQGYSRSNVQEKSVGIIDKYQADIQSDTLKGTPIRVWWARQKQCRVRQGEGQGQFVGGSGVVIPCSWQVTIEVFAVLLIKNDGSVPAPARTKIEAAFTNFLYPRDGDPLAFIQRTVTNDQTLSTDYFSVVNTFSVTKVAGSFLRKNDQDSTITDLRTGTGTVKGNVWTGPTPSPHIPMKDYFEQHQVQFSCSDEDFLGRVPAPTQDPHIHKLEDETKEHAVQTIANNDTPTACQNMQPHNWPLLTIDVWPEFQIVMKDCSIDIGCGIHIVLTLPVLQSRISGHDLWVYTNYPKDSPRVDRMVEKCAFEAGLEGAVVGVALFNFPAALSAFLGAFQDCITKRADETIECMVPGLALLISTQKDWFDVL